MYIWPITPAASVPWLTQAQVMAPACRSNPGGAVLEPVFCKTKKDYIDQEAGE